MTTFRVFTAALLTTCAVSVAAAQSDSPQAQRHMLMEEIGDSTKVLGAMVKGETPYDTAKAQAALDVLIANGKEFVTLFPEGSETGEDTRALPAIWENWADFEAHAAAMVDNAEAAKVAADEGQEPFSVAFREVGGTCRACHTDYRAEK
ncbi:cytochrome c [Acuticoccus sp. MNP-M23]|uniref:c-type cytochrome n=1 Tax=Acuticoccus sp. MNP-M23 TaxID=3072793 RepID=UPI0028151227|nr:cytochrome c [Acuticoccus sp. MNP-M23]WMS43531.1 cytochrome c [Acuticoccus sp. MNP-M23]